MGSQYWRLLMDNAGFDKSDQNDLCHANKQWYFKGRKTGVGHGAYNQPCYNLQFICAGGTKFGYGSWQIEKVKKALEAAGWIKPPCDPKTLSAYWIRMLSRARIKSSDLALTCFSNGQWYYKGKSTRVGHAVTRIIA